MQEELRNERRKESKLADVREVKGRPIEDAAAYVEGRESYKVGVRRVRTGVHWFETPNRKCRRFSSSKRTRRLGGRERKSRKFWLRRVRMSVQVRGEIDLCNTI
jgi:hypothetical protein